MKKTLTLLVIFILTTCNSFAQNNKIDSLLHFLKNTTQDTIKVNIMYALCDEYDNAQSFDSAKRFAYMGLALSNKIGYTLGIANGYTQVGDYYNWLNNPLAINYYQKALPIYEQSKLKEKCAETLYKIGDMFYSQNKYNQALVYYQKAQKIFEQLNLKFKIAESLNMIGMNYYQLYNYPEALKYYQSSLKLSKQVDNKEQMAIIYRNIGEIYFYGLSDYENALINYQESLNLAKDIRYNTMIENDLMVIGDSYTMLNNYNKALETLKEGLTLLVKDTNKFTHSNTLYLLGDVYLKMYDYPNALWAFTKALKIATQIKDKQVIAYACEGLGKVYLKQGRLKEAIYFSKKGLSNALEIRAKKTILNIYSNLISIDSSLGNFKGAFNNSILYNIYRDSVFNGENEKKLTKLQMQYMFDKIQDSIKVVQDNKEVLQKNELKRQKNFLYTSLIGIFLLLIIALVTFYAYRQKRKDNFIIASEKQKSDNLLLNILPSEIAEELKQKGESEAQLFEEVTVLFTDFVNFTGISQMLTPKEIVAELHQCFTAFDAIMEKNGLEKIKTIGDAYLAVCGLPHVDSLHAQKTVQAAIDILDFITKRKENGGLFNIKIGINSGPLVAGIVGVKKFAYDIWGDTVNTAARMEQNSEEGKINISGSTCELIKDIFKTTYRGKVAAKNKGEIDMYFVETV